MFFLNEDPTHVFVHDELELGGKRLKQDLEFIIQNTKQSNGGMTLLEKAVVFNNLDLIKILLDTGCDVKTKSSALLIAMKRNNFKAAKILLNADADVRVIDEEIGINALSAKLLLTQPERDIEYILPHFVNNLKRRNFDAETLAELFVAAKWPFKYVLFMNDAQVSQKFLKYNSNNYCFYDTMYACMKRRDFENVELIMRHGDPNKSVTFYQNLNYFFDTKQFEMWTIFIERLSHWHVIDENALDILDSWFRLKPSDYLQILLDYKIHVEVKQKFGVDLRVSIFRNEKVDAIKLLRNQDFNVNSQGIRQLTALYYSAMNESMKYVKYLLDSGADIEVKGNCRRTALFDCALWNNTKSGRVLLEHGADVQVIDSKGQTVLSSFQGKNQSSSLFQSFLAQLAICHVQGVPIKQQIQNEIDSSEECRNIYETCCRQLQVLKTCQIVKPITLFTVLTSDIGGICRYLRDQDFNSLVDQYKEQHNFHLHYYSTLKNKLIKISTLYRFKCNMANVISEITGIFIDFDHLVVDRISKYSTQRDMDDFLECIYCVEEMR